MALQIIAKGKVELRMGTLCVAMVTSPATEEWFEVGSWAKPYIGKTIVISVEEAEQESE